MLSAGPHAHLGEPVAPHDVWAAWNPDPVVLTGLVLAGWLYRRGSRRGSVSRAGLYFWAGLSAVAMAAISPLDAMSDSLASAHMVQHLLFTLVATPLLAMCRFEETAFRGLPPAWRKRAGRWRRRLRLSPGRLRTGAAPAAVWLLHAGSLWFWHASVPYEAALSNGAVHLLQHGSFLVTGMMFWSLLLPPGRRDGISPGLGVLAIFTMAMQGVFLSLLLTFAAAPWYPSYAETTAAWGVSPLADQQLAGVLMWVPSGLVYTAIGLVLLSSWIGEGDGGRPGGERSTSRACPGINLADRSPRRRPAP